MSPRLDFIPSTAQAMLVKGTSIWARAIQRATGSPYSHVAFAFEGRTYEWDFGGFCSRPIAQYAWAYDLFDIGGMTPERSQLLRRWCLANRGAPYDYGKVLGQGFELIFHWAGLRRLVDSKRAMSCAECFSAALAIPGIDICVGCDETVITPALISRDPLLTFAYSVPAYQGI